MNEQELITKLDSYSEAYYKGGTQITDETFDALEQELRRVNPNSEYFKRNRESSNGYGDKYPHIYSFIGSINKIHTVEESKIFGKKSHFLSAKLDGTSMVAYYENGQLIRALTRGCGNTGLDVTQHYNLITSKYRLSIPKTFTGAIRGEVIFSHSNWEMFKSLHPEAKFPRNSGTGLVNQKTVQPEATLLDYVVYDIVASSTEPRTNFFDVLYSFGFKVASYLISDRDVVPTEDLLKGIYNGWSSVYPMDGLVIRELTSPQYDPEKNIYVYPKNQEAFKFQAEAKVCTVTGIQWGLGRTGKLIPVIQIEPTELSGALVINITGHNAKVIFERQINVGSQITVRRSGEVIPYLDSVVLQKEPALPTHCPYCNSQLSWSDTNVDLLCTNDDCLGKSALKVSNYIKVNCSDIKGIGDSFLDGMLEHFNPSSILDFLTKILIHYQSTTIPTLGNAENGVAKKVIARLTNKNQNLINFLQGLGIKFLGNTFAQEIANSTRARDLFKAILDDKPKDIEVIILEILPGRNAVKDSIIQNRTIISGILELFNNHGLLFEFKNKNDSTGQSLRLYAVTGSLSKPRKEFEEELLSRGWKMTETLSKAEYLINNDNTSNSSKNLKAKELNKPILTEAEFRNKENI